MGRELKRVSLDFDWPLEKVWEGFICPPDVDYDDWNKTEPPTGDGYQLWENVSEGSPVSPVFPDEQSFSDYLINELGYHPVAVVKFIELGFAFSMVISNGLMYSNIDTLLVAVD